MNRHHRRPLPAWPRAGLRLHPGRRPHRRRQRQGLRARHHHLPGVRAAQGGL